ncbi:Holliday junction resolvase RuvX [bacterium]|nr:Holliday junction resolvase RuvX [bacterium]
MPICKLNHIKDAISGGQRLLGLDIGKKTIGLALSDKSLAIASPVKILCRSKFTPDVHSIFDLVDQEDIGAMVLGWPANMDGSVGPRCESVRDFAHAMMRIRDIPVVFQDERLSTQAVESAMVEADMTRAKRAQRRDALAAVWILQSALDRLHDDQIKPSLPTL